MKKHGPLNPRLDHPLPLWMIFPLLFAGIYLAHLTLLRLPYYGDEAGYYIPAAYDFFRTGTLIPFSTLSNAHPPLPSIYLAFWWKASGFTPAVTRTAMCLVSALALLGVFRLSMLLSGRMQVAAATTLLTAIYPVWFAQSTLANADMFAAAGTLWGLAFTVGWLHSDAAGLRPVGIPWAAVTCFSLAALCKETAIVTPAALSLWVLWVDWRPSRPKELRGHLRSGLALLLPALPLLAWYAYHRARTGYIFGNPMFLRYNATATVTPLRIVVAFAHRLLQIFAHMNMFVPVLCTVAAMLLAPLTEDNGRPRPRISLPDQAILYVVLLANAIFFSVLGGALLTRYLLPLYPLVLVLSTATFRRRVRYWWGLVALSAIAFAIGLFVNPPYKFAPDDNLNYADVIRLHQQAIFQIVKNFPNATVMTAWPGTDELTKPELGYVRKPIPVVPIENFSLPAIEGVASSADDFSVLFAFSTKYDPPRLFPGWESRNEALDIRFFDFHRDLEPGAIAHLLDGRIVWRQNRNGEWAAVLHFNRPQVALLRRPE